MKRNMNESLAKWSDLSKPHLETIVIRQSVHQKVGAISTGERCWPRLTYLADSPET